MKKVLPVVLLAALSGCVLPKLNVGAGVSAVVPEDTDSFEGETVQLDLAVRVDVAGLEVEGSVGHKEYTITDGTATNETDLTVIPVAIVAKYGIGAKAARLVLGGGLVWNVNDLEEIGGAIEGLDETAVGYRLIAGGFIMLPGGFDLGAELMYDFTEADIENFGTGDELDMSGLMVRVAAYYQF